VSAPVEKLVAALEIHGCRPKRNGDNAYARCPGHDDKRASLSIGTGNDDRALVKCHAGCKTTDVLAALGLEESDLFPPKDASGKRIVAEYTYVDEAGAELYQAVRFEPKDFRQRHREKGGPWIWKLDGVRRVLYRLPELLAGIASDATVYVVEGEKDTDALRALGAVATCNPMGAGKWRDEYAEALRGARVVIIADKDVPGRTHAAAVEASLRGKAASVRVVEVPAGKDASDYIAAGAKREDFERLEASAPSAGGLVVLSVGEMLERAWPPREQMLSPFVTSKSLSMIHAYRGYGKTWLAHTIGLAVASGGVALPSPFESRCAWSAPTPRRVVLVDGEMPAGVIKARLVQLISGNLYEPDGRLSIIADDVQPEGLPSLSNAAGRERIGEKLGDAEFVILDNISTLFRGLDENEADGWDEAQEWLIRLRREGRSVLLVHHSGKSGAQRGTSKREDVLDAVIKLSRPADYCEEEAARFEIHFEKARGFAGVETLPFEAQLTVKDGLATWTTGPLAEAAETTEMLKLKSAGKSLRAIASELGVDHTTVSRRLKKAARREQADGGAVLPFGAHQPRTTAPGGHK
jgi:hypothetical protein